MDNFDLYGLADDELGPDDLEIVDEELGQLEEVERFPVGWLLEPDFDD